MLKKTIYFALQIILGHIFVQSVIYQHYDRAEHNIERLIMNCVVKLILRMFTYLGEVNCVFIND